MVSVVLYIRYDDGLTRRAHVVPTSNFQASLRFRQRKTLLGLVDRSVELELDVDVTTYSTTSES